MKPLVSVIIVTYNQEQSIARALDSVLMQVCDFNFEIILGEDCSTDNTKKICTEYAQKFPNIIRTFFNKKNKGVIDNYFDCFLECKGKYIADCAGDDFWVDKYKLQKQVDILEADDSISLVHTDWNYYNTITNKIYPPIFNKITSLTRKPIIEGKNLLIPILTQTDTPIILLSTSLFRADILYKAYQQDKYLFRNKEFMCEDLQTSFILAAFGNIAYIPHKTFNYCIGQNSISNPHDEKKRFQFVYGTTLLYLYLIKKFNITSNLVAQNIQHRIYSMLMHIFRSEAFEFIEKVDSIALECGGYNIKNKILRLILINKFLYIPTKIIRNIVVYLKRSF